MASVKDIDALIRRGEFEKAVKSAQSEARRKSNDPAIQDALARAFAAARKFTQCLAAYDRLARMVPKNPKPLADKALLLQQLGQLDEAGNLLRKALKLAPLNGSLLRMLSAGSLLKPDDPVVETFAEAWDDGTLKPIDKVQAGFGLFNALGARGFDYLREANDLQRAANPWSAADRRDEHKGLKAAMEARPWPAATPLDTGARPIFVTGLPRSGTTLVEQILACHPQVDAAGETGLPLRAAYSVIMKNGRFRQISSLTGDEVSLVGQRYLSGMSHFHNVGGVFTDKSMQTILVAGLLRHAIPNARIIFVRRDPRDVGWSIYRNYFESGTHGYSNNLEDIATFAKLTDDMLSFWKEQAPDVLIEVSYENLVNDPGPEIRRILDYCDLEWDDACLSPEKNAGLVKTLSIEQVRSPISPKSVGGWRKYESELQPLLSALGDWAREWD